MRHIALILVGSVLAGCSTAPPQPPSAEGAAELQRLIAGRVAAEPISCLPSYRAGKMVTIDDDTVAFRDGSRVYVNNLQGEGCSNLGSGFYTLVTRSSGGMGLCRGDIADVADVRSGMTVGSCALGDFVPYVGS